MNRIFLLLIMAILVPTLSYAKEDHLEIKKYVHNVLNQGYSILKDDGLPAAEEAEQIKVFLHNNLDLVWMAKYTLGIHNRTLAKEKIEEFIEIYTKFVIKSYSDLAQYYNGETAQIRNIVKIDDGMFIVSMEIVKQSSEPPIKVDYLIHEKNNNNKQTFKVADVIAEGISLLNSQQAEFNNVIINQGIDELIKNLKSKLTSKKK